MGRLIIIDGDPEPATIEFQGVTAHPRKTTNVFDIEDVPTGDAAPDREVFIFVNHFAGSDRALLSATIGGVAAAIHVSAKRTGVSQYTKLISAPLATGTTATVSLTFASGAAFYDVWLASYRATHLLSSTVNDTAIAEGNSAGVTQDLLIDVTKDGILLAGCLEVSDATGFTLAGITEDYDTSVQGSTRVVGGSHAVSADEANRTVSFTRTGGVGSSFGQSTVAASFR